MIHIRLEPEASVSGEKKFYVTQPGSSVATSLSEGEAKEKAVGILEIKRKSFKINPVSTVLPFYKMLRPQKDERKTPISLDPQIPLRSVRPMVFKTIVLDEADADLGGDDERQVQEAVERYLKVIFKRIIL